MSAHCYALARRIYTKRANANGGGVSESHFEADDRYPLFPSALEAKRAYMQMWVPDSANWPDATVAREFGAVVRNEKSVKILKIKS